MLRSIVLVLTLIFGGTAFAANTDFGDLFTPTEGDHSLYIISKIFGNVDQNVLPGEASASGPELLGNVFRVFNIVTLGLGVLMVLYTLITAVMQTAHHGKMMGEKMSSMWTPIRIAVAIALLIPKANGYCIAQVLVMWLVVQGVGAADSIWNTALDYFAEGGSIGDSYAGTPGESGSELNDSLNAVYDNLLKTTLQAMTCVAAHTDNSKLEALYAAQGYRINNQYYIYFGSDAEDIDPSNTSSQSGYQCGSIHFNMFTSSEFPGDDEAERSERANMANETQRNVTFETFVGALSDVAFKIARNEIVYTDRVAKYEFEKVKSAAVNYVSAMGSNSIIFEPPDNEDQFNDAMDTLRQGGWILAGNYYQVLSSIEGTSDFKVYSGNTPNPNFNPSDNDHKVEVGRVDAFYENFDNWDGKVFEQAAQTATQMSREEVENAFNGQSEIFDEMGLTQASADHMEGFLKMISGEEGSTDPVLRAARYGQDLMNTSAKAMITIASLMPLLALGFGWCTASMPGELIWNSMLTSTLPIAYGMLGFLYLQGAALGVYLPMIPLIIFVIGGIGWIFSVIEAMVAAPLVALGLTIEGQNEMYGKAEPAVMILISVLLRPSLMMVGFLTSIMVAWLAVDLINISMMSALEFGGVAPDWMFGHHVVSFMYVGILIALVTKVFGLINYVPEQVWKYLGVNDRNPIAPDEVLSGGRQGGDAMAKQTGDTAQATANSGTTLGQGAGRDFAGKPELTKGGDEKT